MTEAFERRYGVTVSHAWGMTEMSPLGSFCSLKPVYAHLEGDALYDLKVKQGHPPFTVEFRITDDAGVDQPWDGKTFGRLKVRGPAVAKAYFRREDEPILDEQGFFDTGDVATLDPAGYMQITDRSKDVIKSGGEWISSIDLENLAVGHPDVAEAAVIGVAHPKWDERPLLVIVPKPGKTPGKDEMLAFMTGRSRNGGCRTMSCWSTRSRIRRPGRSRRRRCGRCSRTTGCPAHDAGARFGWTARRLGRLTARVPAGLMLPAGTADMRRG